MILGDLKFNFETSSLERFGVVVRNQQPIDEAIQRILNTVGDKKINELPGLVESITDGIEISEIEKSCIKEFFRTITKIEFNSINDFVFDFDNNTKFYIKNSQISPTAYLVIKRIDNNEIRLSDDTSIRYDNKIEINKIEDNNGASYIYPSVDVCNIIRLILQEYSSNTEDYNTDTEINTIGEGMLVLHVNKANNKEKTDTIGDATAEYLNKFADLIEEAKQANTPDDQILKDVQAKLDEEADNKVKDFLNKAGLPENPTDDEIQEVAEEAANKLAGAIQNGALNNNSKTGNELADTLLDGLKDNSMNGSVGEKGKNPIGLRYDIYNAMTLIGKIPDPTMVLFPAAVSTVIANYFMIGTLIITIHLGGTAIVGVGTKLLSLALPGLPKAIITLGNNVPGMPGYQSGLCSGSYPNFIDQGKAWSNAISGDLYQTGSTITELVIGTMVGSPSPIPFVGTGMKQQLTTTVLKILILVASMASYIVMQAAGMAAQVTGKQETLENILGIPKMFKDLNDFFAAMMSVAVKAGLLLTLTKTLCTTTASTGTGLIIPIGP